ncbi:MAG: hypothetical protein WBL55_10775, partial [Xanthobacteraceae bacterium]
LCAQIGESLRQFLCIHDVKSFPEPSPVLYRLHYEVSKATAGVTVLDAADALAKVHARNKKLL